ncbi:hypothetical protein Tco_1370416 [Tanacetum coccineum]
MMTYLKHVGNKKHSDLKNKTFDDIQVLYERIKMNNEKFLAVGSNKDERKIKEMNEKAKDPGLRRLKKKVVKETSKEDDSAKVPAEHEVTEHGTKKMKSGHIKMIARKRPRPQQDNDDDELRLSLIIIPDEDKEVDYEILDRKYPIIEWKFEYLTTTPQFDESKGLKEVNQNMVVRSNGYLNDTPEVKSWLVQDQTVPGKDKYGLSMHHVMTMKHWLVQKQTAFGKDKSNPLIVGSLLKTIRLSIHLVVYNEELAITEQTATSKGTSNLLLAGSLPKTTKPT